MDCHQSLVSHGQQLVERAQNGGGNHHECQDDDRNADRLFSGGPGDVVELGDAISEILNYRLHKNMLKILAGK